MFITGHHFLNGPVNAGDVARGAVRRRRPAATAKGADIRAIFFIGVRRKQGTWFPQKLLQNSFRWNGLRIASSSETLSTSGRLTMGGFLSFLGGTLAGAGGPAVALRENPGGETR